MAVERMTFREFWHLYKAWRNVSTKPMTVEDLRGFLVKRFGKKDPQLAARVAGLSLQGMRGLSNHFQQRSAGEGRATNPR